MWCSACCIVNYCACPIIPVVRLAIMLNPWLSNQNKGCQHADWPRHKLMCFKPAQLAAEGSLDEISHPQYNWTWAEMSTAIFQFYISHKEPLAILAINSFKLFKGPVVDGKLDSGVWVEQTHNWELVIYLECTVIPKPSCCHFKQLEVIGTCMETVGTAEEEVGMPIFILCMVLLPRSMVVVHRLVQIRSFT